MTRPDDSALAPEDLRVVEERARNLLDRADAWNRFPVPINDVLAAAKVRVAPNNAFDFAGLLSYLRAKTADSGVLIKSAISKVFGLYDAGGALIHIDNTVVKAKQTFLKLHETGHHDIPTHRKMYRFFQDCSKTLAPEVADQFEREANNFAHYILFKGNRFAEYAADLPLEIQTPISLAKKFGASIYASAREFARTNRKACAVFCLDPLENVEGTKLRAPVRRIEASSTFQAQFGQLVVDAITPSHALWPTLPIGRGMAEPVLLTIADVNGTRHECVAETFDTTYNILILLYPQRSLAAKRVVMST